MLQLSGDDITSNGWVIPDYTLQSRPTNDWESVHQGESCCSHTHIMLSYEHKAVPFYMFCPKDFWRAFRIKKEKEKTEILNNASLSCSMELLFAHYGGAGMSACNMALTFLYILTALSCRPSSTLLFIYAASLIRCWKATLFLIWIATIKTALKQHQVKNLY